MTDDEAFLAAIRADPTDEGPRLIFADWLEEHDHPLEAEFLRVTCESKRLRATPASPLRDLKRSLRLLHAKTRQDELLAIFWEAPLSKWTWWPRSEWNWWYLWSQM